MNKIRKKGFAGGGVALGYEAKNKELAINKENAETVKNIFYLKRYKRMSLNAIATKLNQEQIKTARGGKWYAGTVRYILRNGIYKGNMNYNGVEVKVSKLSLT